MNEISYTFSKEDYWQYQLFAMRELPQIRGIVRKVRIMWAVCGVIIAPMLILLLRENDPTVAYFAGGLLALVSVLLAVFYPLMHRAKLRKIIEKGTLNDYSEKNVIYLEPDGIRDSTEKGDFTYRYSSIIRIYARQEYIYVEVGPGRCLCIPVRAFADESEKSAFLQFLSEKTGVQIQ